MLPNGQQQWQGLYSNPEIAASFIGRENNQPIYREFVYSDELVLNCGILNGTYNTSNYP